MNPFVAACRPTGALPQKINARAFMDNAADENLAVVDLLEMAAQTKVGVPDL